MLLLPQSETHTIIKSMTILMTMMRKSDIGAEMKVEVEEMAGANLEVVEQEMTEKRKKKQKEWIRILEASR